jgi:hypothetical protein
VLDAATVQPGELLGLQLARGRVQARAERVEAAASAASPSAAQGKDARSGD